jgi:cysteine dioxygenase
MPASHARIRPADLLGLELPSASCAEEALSKIEGVLGDLSLCKPSWDILAPHVEFAPAGYLRKRLYRDASWEMLLLCWLPGQKTVIHDHGGSVGAVMVLCGQLDECQYMKAGEGQPLSMQQLRRFGPSEVALETVEAIHKNENRGDVPAISLHLYSLPLRVLNSYDPATGASHAVSVREGPTVAIGGKPVRRK